MFTKHQERRSSNDHRSFILNMNKKRLILAFLLSCYACNQNAFVTEKSSSTAAVSASTKLNSNTEATKAAECQSIIECKKGCTSIDSTTCDRLHVLYEKACVSRDRKACVMVAQDYESGNGYRKIDLFKAFSFYERGCQLSHYEACEAQGRLYERGQGVEIDALKAVHFYGIACKAKVSSACQSLSKLWTNGAGNLLANPLKAEQIARESCANEDREQCFELGLMYLAGTHGLKKDKESATKAFEQSCTHQISGSPKGCYAWSYFDAPKKVELLQLYYKASEYACEKKIGSACYLLSTVYENGLWSVAKDDGKKKAFLTKACESEAIWLDDIGRKKKDVCTQS
jgi:uncharacterized protein